jgi:ABC-type Fe3+-siderophore transport system permease subunit
MNLDLRIPMGLMFTLVGLILSVFGLMTNGDAMYAKSLGLNANLYWGVVLLIFGSIMFILGRRGQKAADAAPPKPVSESEPVRRGH